MDLLTNSLQSERYRGCSVTTLGPAELAEIGRAMAHYGLLVARVREFVSYVSTQTHRLPPSVGSKESIKLLPSVLEIIRPAFSPNDVPILRRASDQVSMVREAVDRFHYSVWGTSSFGPEKFGRTEYRRCKGAGCWRDQSIYSTSDVHELAMEISLAISYLGKVQGVFQEKLAEESHVLRKKLNRRRKSPNRS